MPLRYKSPKHFGQFSSSPCFVGVSKVFIFCPNTQILDDMCFYKGVAPLVTLCSRRRQLTFMISHKLFCSKDFTYCIQYQLFMYQRTATDTPGNPLRGNKHDIDSMRAFGSFGSCVYLSNALELLHFYSYREKRQHER